MKTANTAAKNPFADSQPNPFQVGQSYPLNSSCITNAMIKQGLSQPLNHDWVDFWEQQNTVQYRNLGAT